MNRRGYVAPVMRDAIISLTSIPPRLPLIGQTLADLVSQTARIAEVRLYVPRRHRRYPLDEARIPALPPGVSLHLTDEDWGPATKVLAAARDLRGQDVEIIFCDDDQRYDPGWAARLIAARAERPDACIAQLGYDLEHRPRTSRFYPQRSESHLPRAGRKAKGWTYRLRRAASLGRWRRSRLGAPGYVDILQGYRGAMIRPEFLPPEAWAIPEVLWTVDDPWLSGQMLRNGVPIWMIRGDAPGRHETEAGRVEPLRWLVHRDHGRERADALTIEYFRKHYGLWPDRRPPQLRGADRIRVPEPLPAGGAEPLIAAE